MMRTLEILPTDEIKANGSYVGRVEWSAPLVDALSRGAWVRDNDDEVNDLQADLYEYEDENADLKEKIRLAIYALEEGLSSSALAILKGELADG